MKKLLILAVMMLTTMTVSAQMPAGSWAVMPKAGFNLAKITDLDDASMKLGLVAGADLIYQINEPLAVSVGLLYSMQGAKDKYKVMGTSFDVKYNTDYINIPIMANFYVIPGLAIKAGIQPGLNVNINPSRRRMALLQRPTFQTTRVLTSPFLSVFPTRSATS